MNKDFLGNLKSNMDRFIEMFQLQVLLHHLYLKSNMDRFIGVRIKYIKSK